MVSMHAFQTCARRNNCLSWQTLFGAVALKAALDFSMVSRLRRLSGGERLLLAQLAKLGEQDECCR